VKEVKLKPCPFCGGMAELVDLRYFHTLEELEGRVELISRENDAGVKTIGVAVVCQKCPGALTAVMCYDFTVKPGQKREDAEAIAAWNRRAKP
jgi:hypothetical protein